MSGGADTRAMLPAAPARPPRRRALLPARRLCPITAPCSDALILPEPLEAFVSRGTESLQTYRWGRESCANPFWVWGAEAAADKLFMIKNAAAVGTRD